MKKLTKMQYYMVVVSIGILLGSYFFRSNINSFFNHFSTSTTKNTLEFIYLLSSPLLLFVAVLGLKQIKVAKAKMATDAKRESYKLAVEQCDKYLNQIIPMQDRLDEYLRDHNIERLGKTELKINGDSVIIKNTIEKVLKEDTILLKQVVVILNIMESFAVFFTSGVAEESVAYNSIGNTYIRKTESYLPVICTTGGEGFNNVFKLYINWSHKKEKEQAIYNKEIAERKINENCIVEIRSIGID